MRYLPHTEADIREMLKRIGVPSLDALFSPIPQGVQLRRSLNLEPALDETRLMRHIESLAEKNTAAHSLSFLGAGTYHHHVPPALDQLLLRSEFYTAYTPYQAEVSQGTLQAVFEFQTLVADLLGMEVANASMYDGASATAEAVLMARRVTGRTRCIISEGVHPEYIETVHTYLRGLHAEGEVVVETCGVDAAGTTDLRALRSLLKDDTAAVVIGYPNFFGCVEDLEGLRDSIGGSGALLVTVTMEPYALSVLQPPGTVGADIAVGEGQALAVPPQYGGPGVGLFACKQAFVQKMPGRLVGETVDERGERGYVLTLSTREQHIRRDRATSNICTNHGLIALAFAIRASLLGKAGFEHVGRLCLSKAEYLKQRLLATGLFVAPLGAPTFNEFVLRSTNLEATALLGRLSAQGILGGVPVSRFFPERRYDVLIAVTERHEKEDLDRFVEAVATC